MFAKILLLAAISTSSIAAPIQESVFVGRNFRGESILEIDYYIPLSRYRGARLTKLTLRAFSKGPGQAEVAFCSQGDCSLSFPVEKFDNDIEFNPVNEIVDSKTDWSFKVRGNVYVDSLSVQLLR